MGDDEGLETDDDDDELDIPTPTTDPFPDNTSQPTPTTDPFPDNTSHSCCLFLQGLKDEVRALKTLVYRKNLNLTICFKEQHSMRAIFEERIFNITQSFTKSSVADEESDCGEGEGEKEEEEQQKKEAQCTSMMIPFGVSVGLLLVSVICLFFIVVRRYPCAACARCSIHCGRCEDLVRGTLAEAASLGHCVRSGGGDTAEGDRFSVRMSRLAAAEEERRQLEECIANVEEIVSKVSNCVYVCHL